MLAKKF